MAPGVRAPGPVPGRASRLSPAASTSRPGWRLGWRALRLRPLRLHPLRLRAALRLPQPRQFQARYLGHDPGGATTNSGSAVRAPRRRSETVCGHRRRRRPGRREAMIAALAVLLALAVVGSLIVLLRRGGAQAASFDPVALEDAVYSELYGERTVRVLPGRKARSAADGCARIGAPEDLRPEHAGQRH